MPNAKSARTKQQVIEGALRALCSRGVLATTTRQIATEANVPLASLHYHFKNKSALLLAVFEHQMHESTAALRAESTDSPDIATCIDHIMRAAWRYLTRTREQQLVQYELTLYSLREGAEWLAARQYDAYIKLYRDILHEVAERTGELNLAACTALARFMLASIDGLLLQTLAKPNRSQSTNSLEALIQSSTSYALALGRDSKG